LPIKFTIATRKKGRFEHYQLYHIFSTITLWMEHDYLCVQNT